MAHSTPISTVLFNLDGTLTDPLEGFASSMRHALVQLGRPTLSDAALARYIGPPLQETMALLLDTGDRREVEHAVTLYRQRYAETGIIENRVYPNIASVLSTLHEYGVPLYVATSKPHVFAERILERHGLRRYFKAVYGSELDGTRSKKVELIAHILHREGVPRSGTYMIGDRAQDIRGAIACSVTPIGALWGYGSREELQTAGAAMMCESPVQLIELLATTP